MDQPKNIKDDGIISYVIRHYITSSIFFLLITILLFYSRHAFIGHYFHPKTLAITHITTLGWVSMIIIGSLYQLVPVIGEVKIKSKFLVVVTYYSLLIGTILLAISFWFFKTGALIQVSATILLTGITLLIVNLYLTIKQNKETKIEMDFILTSLFWFWLAGFFGTLLAFNFSHLFLPKNHLHYLKIHAHIGLIGWFISLIVGVASKLIPMFLISGNLSKKRLVWAYYLINIGLIAYTVDTTFFDSSIRQLTFVTLIVTGILCFLHFIYEAYKKRLRTKIDIGLKQSLVSVILFLIPIVLSILLKTNLIRDQKMYSQVATAIVFSLLFGFIGLLILGQTIKNLSFIVWLKKHQPESSGNAKILPKDLYSEKIANSQFFLFLLGFFTMLLGIIISNTTSLSIGSMALVGTAILYNINIYKMVFNTNTTLK